MKEKTRLSHEVQMLDFETSNSKPIHGIHGKILLSQKTTPLQRELFLTMIDTINLSHYSLPSKVLC